MARVISEILNADSIHFNHLIEKWENRTGRQGHDIALYSEMRRRALFAINELGLDPTDTISKELYFALQERVKQDNEWLSLHMGITKNTTPHELITKAVEWVDKHTESKNIWVCRPALIKGFLKKQPPKTVMKSLGLRSIDSMLKKSHPAEILVLAQELETKDWVKKFRQQFKSCRTKDFDVTQIQFIIITDDRKTKIKKSGFPVTRFVSPHHETGAVVVIPPVSRFPLDLIAIVTSIAEAVYDIRKHSSLYRTLSVRKDFGLQVYNISDIGMNNASQDISEIGWNSLHRHLIGNEYAISQLEQPHLTKEDLIAENYFSLLVGQNSRFQYWKKLEHVVFDNGIGKPVSMNLLDVIESASNKIPHEKGTTKYARMHLWEELWARYLASDNVIEDVIDSYLRQ